MGHSEIATTAVYAKISNKIVDDEMKRVWDEPGPSQQESKQYLSTVPGQTNVLRWKDNRQQMDPSTKESIVVY